MKNTTYYNAGAGTGKTHKLMEKMYELVSDGNDPSKMIFTTFTRNAAAEFRERTQQKLCEKNKFEAAEKVKRAMIGTIHSTALQFVQKYWFELGLSPATNILDEESSELFLSQSLASIPTTDDLSTIYAYVDMFNIKKEYPETGPDYDIWKYHLKKVIALTTNYELDDYSQSLARSKDLITQLYSDPSMSEITDTELEYILNSIRKAVADNNRITKKKPHYDWCDQVWDGRNDKSLEWYRNANHDRLKYADTAYSSSVEKIKKYLLLPKWDFVKKTSDYVEVIFNMADKWRKSYAEYKTKHGLIDYNDIEKYMLDLLDKEAVRNDIKTNYKYLFVDEFQDCSPIQLKIFDKLSELMEHSYWVGDYKQSIYGFRGSDVALIKDAVNRIDKTPGCEYIKDKLKKSWRSVDDIVNVCNHTFLTTFQHDGLSKDEIEIDTNAELSAKTNKADVLRYWDMRKGELWQYVVDLIKRENVAPHDIMILQRNNNDLKELPQLLRDHNIPVDTGNMSTNEMNAHWLVWGLTGIIANNSDSEAKATVATLSSNGMTVKKLIEDKLDWDNDPAKKPWDFKNDEGLMDKLLKTDSNNVSLCSELRQQPIGDMVESMIVELDLFNEVKKWDNPIDERNCLAAIIADAKAYEQRCIQMALPATVNGFRAHLEIDNIKLPGNSEGVKIMTYHKSKGLQAKYVILSSLGNNITDENNCIKREIYGTHILKDNSGNHYILLLPKRYSGNQNIDGCYRDRLDKPFDCCTPSVYEYFLNKKKSEETRLMYVGMTRAKEALILHLQKKSKSLIELADLSWFNGIDGITASLPDAAKTAADILNTDDYFHKTELDFTIDYHTGLTIDPALDSRCDYTSTPMAGEALYLQPSAQKRTCNVKYKYDLAESRIKVSRLSVSDDVFGNCIHQIFAAIEDHTSDAQTYIEEVLQGYGITSGTVNWEDILKSWQLLTEKLAELHGPATLVLHERPFSLHRANGQYMNGSIDLVWQTNGGNVLLDFKSNQMDTKQLLDPNNTDHYVGHYGGQLDAYTEALESNGEKVIARYIYYPVSRMLVELDI